MQLVHNVVNVLLEVGPSAARVSKSHIVDQKSTHVASKSSLARCTGAVAVGVAGPGAMLVVVKDERE